jgi:hypothetical protein
MARSRDLSKVLSSSTSVALDNELGLSLITPTSIAATGGSGSISTNGVVTFSGASSMSLNGCFTSTYANYRIIFAGSGSNTTVSSLRMRLRTGGSDNSVSSYFSWLYYRTNTASGQGYNATDNKFEIGYAGNIYWNATMDITSPQESNYTGFTSLSSALANSNNGSLWPNGIFYQTTSFDGFTIFADSGTLTGTIRVYGYRG